MSGLPSTLAVVLLLSASPASAVNLITDLDPEQRLLAVDGMLEGRGLSVLRESDLPAVGQLAREAVHGRTRISVVWENEPGELSINFDLARGGDSTMGSFALLTGLVQFEVDTPVRYELSGQVQVADSGGGDGVVLNVTLQNVTAGRFLIEQLFDGMKRSDATPNERLALGLAGGDFRDEEEGSLAGELLPVRPGDRFQDRRYEVRYAVQLSDFRDDAGDIGATATGEIRLKLTPFAPVPEPSVSVSKIDTLVVDDGDGRVEPGETLEYRIVARNTGTADATGVVLEDVLDAHVDLEVGSVTSSQGTVVSGNLAGDTDVVVDVGTLAVGAGAEVTFRVLIDDPLPARVQHVSNRGRLTGDNFPVAETDDPHTAASGDDTVTVLANMPLDRCERDVEDLELELGLCSDALEAALVDSDGDGILDLVDRCPETSSGAETDALGCSQAEFCATATRTGRFPPVVVCNFADWRNDEPLFPRDCRWRRGACQPRTLRPGRRH